MKLSMDVNPLSAQGRAKHHMIEAEKALNADGRDHSWTKRRR